MFPHRILIGWWLATVLSATAAQAQTSAQLYEQALRKERTAGDVAGAIVLYQRVAAGTDRQLAARALIRIGDLYEQSSREQALKAYRRVVTEFADQKDATHFAQARLAALSGKGVSEKASGNLGMRLVLGDNFDPSGMPSADGRYLSFVDWQHGGNIGLYDLAAGTGRTVTQTAAMNTGGGYALASALSRDGKRIAYFFIPQSFGWLPQIRMVNSDGTGDRVLFANEDSSVNNIQVHDFTPDGTAVAVVLAGPAGLVRVGLLSTADGAFQLVKQLNDVGSPLRVAVSPDGKWIALDEIVDTVQQTRDIVVLTRNGKEKGRIKHAAGSQNPIWSPDGKHLLFSSARSGTFGLWAVRVIAGVPQAQPFEIKSQMPWGFTPMGFAGDKLMYYQDTGGGDVFSAAFDQQSARVTGAPENLLPLYQGMNTKGVLSKDGNVLFYASRRGGVRPGSLTLVVRDVASGGEQEFARPFLAEFGRLAPSPDGRYVLTRGNGLAGKQMLQLLDTRTNQIRTLAEVTNAMVAISNGVWSPDGRTIYFNRTPRGGLTALVRYDLASGDTASTPSPGAYALAVSPSGDSVAQAVRKGNMLDLWIGPARGSGEFQRITQLSDFGDPSGRLNFAALAFTPDGTRIAFGRSERKDNKETGNTEVFTVPLGGGEPESTGLAMRGLRNISFAPGGRLIFTAQDMFKLEIWTIENLSSRLPN